LSHRLIAGRALRSSKLSCSTKVVTAEPNRKKRGFGKLSPNGGRGNAVATRFVRAEPVEAFSFLTWRRLRFTR